MFQPSVVSSVWEVCTCRVVRAANARVTAFVGRGHGVVAAWVSYSGVTRPDISSPCISVCSSPVFRDCDVTTVVVSVGISRVVLKPGTGRASLLLGMSQQDELSFRGTAGWRTCDQMLGSLMASGGYRRWGRGWGRWMGRGLLTSRRVWDEAGWLGSERNYARQRGTIAGQHMASRQATANSDAYPRPARDSWGTVTCT